MLETAAPGVTDHYRRGVQLVEGREVAADLVAGREAFRMAVAAGDARAARIYAGFLAVGYGGPRDWPAAVELLRAWSNRDPLASKQVELLDAMRLTDVGDPQSLPQARRLHGSRRLDLFSSLLTPPECGFLVELVQRRFQPAAVFASPGENRARPAVRDNEFASFSMFEEYPFVHAINRRIAAATGTDVRQGEPLQIMRYFEGQQYRPHVDGVGGGSNRRTATAVTYLNADYEGGETEFTELGLRVRGRTGDMVVWNNLGPDGELDRSMRHAGRPVMRGTKLIASRWILQRPPLDEIGNFLATSFWDA